MSRMKRNAVSYNAFHWIWYQRKAKLSENVDTRNHTLNLYGKTRVYFPITLKVYSMINVILSFNRLISRLFSSSILLYVKKKLCRILSFTFGMPISF